MLGVLKAGAAYAPMDPEFPESRLRFLLTDTKSPVVLTLARLEQRLPQGDYTVLRLDADWPMIAKGSRQNGPCRSNGESLAYVIYTSGSTGEPKGVRVPHRAVNRLVLDTDYIDLQANDRVAQAATPTFDAATFEIWGALLSGACLVGVERNLTLAPAEFAAFLRDERITTLFLTTALFNQMAREVPVHFMHFGACCLAASWSTRTGWAKCCETVLRMPAACLRPDGKHDVLDVVSCP